MSSLPTELVRHIIQLALPIVSYKTYRERYKLLLACSLVNRTWNALAQKELRKEIFVYMGEDVTVALGGRAGEPGMRIYLGAGSGVVDDSRPLEISAKSLVNVKSLSIAYACLDAEFWPPLDDLQALHLNYVDFGFEQDPQCLLFTPALPPGCLFRSLTTLSLVDICLNPSFPHWSTWFNSANLPHLRRLAMCDLQNTGSLGDEMGFVRALSALAPQIQDLTVAEGPYSGMIIPVFPWSACTALQRLAIYSERTDPSPLFSAALAQLPVVAPLSHLIVGHVNTKHTSLDTLTFWGQPLLATFLEALNAD